MFARRVQQTESFKHRAGKAAASSSKHKRSFRDPSFARRVERSQKTEGSPPLGSTLTSAIITLCVGRDQRLFAAHEDVLCLSPYFAAALKGQFLEAHARRVDLPEDQPEIFSCVLEYLYKGDYYPRLLHNKRHDTWELEDAGAAVGARNIGTINAALDSHGLPVPVLKDTVVYCAADRFGLEELKRLALRKQGLQANVPVPTILASARWAYENTPDSDSRLRAHYIALIIRSRAVFKRSGTMQQEMIDGGKFFFDLFVAMCNHLDDITAISKSPR